MATLQTGTAPNQIPTNGDLGDLAFQSKESVQFTGGRGALSSINLNQIYKEIAATAVDVFVYDTSKDSDGGAWRRRTQHTSWYNETLNTATRGSRREFPSVAVIVATSNAITIYDGDDSNMPMWMVFNEGSGKCLYTNGFSLTAVTALNGILSWAGFRLGVIRFLSDSFSNYEQSFYNYSIKPLSERNGTGTTAYTTSPVILNLYTNDVAMTVLANAPIDAATGLPIPTIAVATNSGVSVIKDNGTIINLLTTSGTQNSISFTGSKGLETHGGGGVAFFGWGWYSMPQASTNTSDYLISDNAWSTTNIRRPGSNGNSVLYPMTTTNYGIVIRESAGVSTTDKLILIALTNPAGYSLQSYLTTKYNTGWMPGDIRGAWLSDNTAETMVGSELVTNGTFSSDTSWTKEAGWSISGGVATATTANYSDIMQDISTVVGKTYTMSVQVTSWSSGQFRFFATGTGYIYPTVSGTGYVTVSFIATSTTTSVRVGSGAVSGNFSIDNFSVRLADSDRSVNNKGLQTFGSITKTPVATGADLVGYSGFGSGKYLYYPTSTNLSFGSGDFSLIMWMKSTNTNTGYSFNQLVGIRIAYQGAGKLRFHVYGNGGNPQYIDSTTVPINVWHQAMFIRRNGKLEIYINAINATESIYNNATETFSTATETLIGVSDTTGGSTYTGELALIRLSGTVPSAEQIAKMYNDEKYLFQDNAKATLYGTSDSVTALAYDEDTQLLHAGTSSGRSVFRGLRRVDNTTTAVGAAISAANGLVAED